MHQIICRSAGASPHTPLGELTALSQTHSWFRGGALWEKGRTEGTGERRDGRGRGGEGRGGSPGIPKSRVDN